MADLTAPGLSGPTPGKDPAGGTETAKGRRGAPGGGGEGAPSEDARRRPAHRTSLTALTLGALGVVFGDIGTSPLYALKTAFSIEGHAVHPTAASVYGVISLVVWSVTIVVSLKYVALVMRADNDGEGGMALIALIHSARLPTRTVKVSLVALGIFGAALFYGDGMITPAISVLSAVEGLEVVSPASRPSWSRSRSGSSRACSRSRGSGRAPSGVCSGRSWRSGSPRSRSPGSRSLAPRGAAGPFADVCGGLLPGASGDGVRRPRRRRPGRDRRGGALRRHGALRPSGDSPGVVLLRLPGWR